jgi:hypothetical protein
VLEWLVNRFIYYPTSRWMMTPADLGLEAEDVFLTPEPGVQLHAWFFPRPKPLTIPTSLGEMPISVSWRPLSPT